MDTKALEIKNVSKSYGKNLVLKDVSLTTKEGEFIVLLGPSGCGKTTLLRAISGLAPPDTGELLVRGKNITNLPTNKRDMGIVFQNYALFPHMTVKKNVAFGLKMRKVAKEEIDKRVAEGLRKVSLEGYEERKITQMSGGQQQRVALARALVLNPTLLLLDEPLSNLDAKLRASVRVEIAQIQRSLGITTIMVTHDQVEAMTMGDRIVLLQEGVIQQDAKPIEIYEKPANMFVAGFVGSPSINFFNLKVQADTVVFTDIDLEIKKGQLMDILSEDCRATLKDGKYVLGVRPDHLLVDAENPIFSWPSQIRYMERLGAETLVHEETENGKTSVSLIPGLIKELKNSENVCLSVWPERGHLFDAETGCRVQA